MLLPSLKLRSNRNLHQTVSLICIFVNMAEEKIRRLEAELESVTREKQQAAKYGLQLLGEMTDLKDQLNALQVRAANKTKHK